MEITAITSQKRRRDRFNIFIDGTFAFALDADTLIKQNLKRHDQLTQEEINHILKDSELAKWKNKVLEFLSRRPRSIREISDYLKKKEIGEETTRLVITDLTDKKLIDDKAFAIWFVEQRQTFRPKSANLIKLELKQKGISSEIIQEVLSETFTSEIEMSQALELAIKKLRHAPLTSENKLKIQQLLARRGFNWGTIKDVLNRLKSIGND